MIEGTYTREETGLHFKAEGSGPPILLVHGVGSTLDDWDVFTSALKDSYRVIRMDLRGHGQSSKARTSYSLQTFATDLMGLMSELNIPTFHIIGNSLGGMIAQYVAIYHQDRIKSACFLSSAAGRTEEEAEMVRARIAILRNGDPGEHFRRSLTRWYTPAFINANSGLLAKLEERNKLNDPWCYSEAYSVLAYSDLARELGRVTAPTLIATGEFDIGSNPRMAKLMHEKIPGSELHVLQGQRHGMLRESPTQVLELVTRFLKRHEATNHRPITTQKRTIGGRIPTLTGTISASRAVRAGDYIYVSGMLPRRGDQIITQGTIEEQTRAALDGLRDILSEANSSLTDVVKVTVHMRERSDFPGFDRVFGEFFPTEPPARCAVQNNLLVDAKLNIEAIAYTPECTVRE